MQRRPGGEAMETGNGVEMEGKTKGNGRQIERWRGKGVQSIDPKGERTHQLRKGPEKQQQCFLHLFTTPKSKPAIAL
jgi:hypothetical protein